MNKRTIKSMAYRLKLRKQLQQQEIEVLKITKEEVIREIDRRNKKK